MNKKQSINIHHYTLDNGLNIIINPDHKIPNVSAQLWYNVGSKDEQAGERGLAHLLEHMIFKGTERMSESDINVITNKLSGYTNAFTSYDYTGYLFDFPKNHWHAALDMLSDCMGGCTFKEDLLQSELKAVIQELKMYNDDYESSLVEGLTSTIFSDHPYHHPIIGYKQDLWSITHDGLMAFYKKHYVPNNATLVVVGDVEPEEALADIKRYFGQLKPNYQYQKSELYAQEDIQQKSVCLYRDVQRPILMCTWRVPGMQSKKDFYIRVLAQILGQGEGSRLYRRLVDELQLATDVGMFLDDLFEHSLLFLAIDPIDEDSIDQIKVVVQEEVERYISEGFLPDELQRGIKQVAMEQLVSNESLQDRAYAIGRGFLATGDPHLINSALLDDSVKIEKEITALLKRWIRPTVMHSGSVLPLHEHERAQWVAIQQQSDEADQVILSRKVRQTELEQPKYALQLEKKEMPLFDVAQHETIVLANGLRVLFGADSASEKAELLLAFDYACDADPDDLQGLCNFVFAMMQEGTTHYSKEQFTQLLESHGMRLEMHAGAIALTLFKQDLELGLRLLNELVEHATFDEAACAKVRKQLLSDIDSFWDSPNQFVGQLAREHIYQGHPWSKQQLGTAQTISAITTADLKKFYVSYVNPQNARLAIVADVSHDVLSSALERTLAQWTAVDRDPVSYPSLALPLQKEIVHAINRDQVVLAFAGLSVDRKDPKFDPLLLFDQAFTGGAAGSMSSRLFALREQTGLFYTIGGSLVHGASEQPGMAYVRTIVSGDRLAEAERVIKESCMQVAQGITPDELVAAKDAIVQNITDQFSLQRKVAQSFLHIDKLGLPTDYYAKRAAVLRAIDKRQVDEAVQKVFDANALSTIKAGRL